MFRFGSLNLFGIPCGSQLWSAWSASAPGGTNRLPSARVGVLPHPTSAATARVCHGSSDGTYLNIWRGNRQETMVTHQRKGVPPDFSIKPLLIEIRWEAPKTCHSCRATWVQTLGTCLVMNGFQGTKHPWNSTSLKPRISKKHTQESTETRPNLNTWVPVRKVQPRENWKTSLIAASFKSILVSYNRENPNSPMN